MELGFIHRFVPASDPNCTVTVLALHGTGGDESDLIPLAETLVPGAAILIPRGKVLENDMPRFFRRLREDVKFRARELVEFIASAAAGYQFDAANLMAIGYSNGANIAAAILLLHPGAISRAVLLRTMVPIEPEHAPNLEGTTVFMAAGRRDPTIPPAETERLAAMLREYGAQITLEWNDADHRLATSDIEAARKWVHTVTIRGNDEHSV